MDGVLIFVLFGVLAVVAALIGAAAARRRREEAALLAARLGLAFHAQDPWDLPARYGRFDLFRRGGGRRASNVMVGRLDGRAAAAFDYRYTTGSGKNRTTHHRQAVVLELPIRAPGLRMRAETFFDRLGEWVGFDDIDFESEEFSRRYHVKCEDRRFAYDIFHARLIEYLLRRGDAPDIEMGGPHLVVYDRRGAVADFERLLGVGREIARQIPEYVLKARAAAPAGGGTP